MRARRSLLALCLFASPAAAEPAVSWGGYLETYYQLHAQSPSNRVTNLRGFDRQSRTFVLSNAVLDVKAAADPVTMRVVLQIGTTGATYYATEPDAELWRHVQTATASVALPRDLTLEAGLFPSPIGPEVFAVKDNMNWSRSNLFFGLPFYHLGARLSAAVAGSWTMTGAVYNGWNAIVDNNDTPSVALAAAYADGDVSAQLLYFGGVERPTGSPEGSPWRHLFDAVVQVAVAESVTLAAHLDAGLERGVLGTSSWLAGAMYAKVELGDELFVAVRSDAFREYDDGGSRLFWSVPWVASATATLAAQPVAGLSARLEVRHDHAGGDAFFGGAVPRDPSTMAAIPNRRTQDTITVGLTAWF